MKRTALITTVAAIGYAKEPTPAKMPEVPVEAPKAAKVAPEVTPIATLNLTLPESGRRGGAQSAYLFTTLEVGQFFGVKNKTRAQISAAVSNANRKGKQEVKDANGNVVNTVVTRHFVAHDVTPDIAKQIEGTDLAGSTVLVTRDK